VSETVASIDARSAPQDLPVWQASVQRRTVLTLLPSQVLGGVGTGSIAGVGSLLAASIAHTDSLAGLAGTSSALGAAVLAVPMSRIMDAHGRRPGLTAGYVIAVAGAATVIFSAVHGIFALLIVGMFLFGAGNASNLQSRYAAIDCATPAQRSRSLSAVVWATTLGAIAGPNLIPVGEHLAHAVGIPGLAGSFLISGSAFIGASAIVWLVLRPDPLLIARSIALQNKPRPASVSLRVAARAILDRPRAIVAVLAMSAANTVMVGVMSMTPIAMSNMGSDLHVIGLVISGHIAGMYAFSPVVGWLTDRLGRIVVVVIGQLIMVVAFAFAGLGGASDPMAMGGGLFLLGLGWSCSLIAGSTLLSESLPDDVRPRAQGLSDLIMGLCGAGGGAVAGVVLALASYGALNAVATVLIIAVLAGSTVVRTRRATRPDATDFPIHDGHQPEDTEHSLDIDEMEIGR
jgi:MFS family permease